VPPPPVAGATVGTGLGVAVGLGVLVGLGVVAGLGVTVRLGDTVGLGVVPDEALAVAEALSEDDDVGAAVGEDDVVQAETVTEMSMIKMPQLTAVSLARAFMKPHPKGLATITVKAK
jgi:hypothetical protein